MLSYHQFLGRFDPSRPWQRDFRSYCWLYTQIWIQRYFSPPVSIKHECAKITGEHLGNPPIYRFLVLKDSINFSSLFFTNLQALPSHLYTKQAECCHLWALTTAMAPTTLMGSPTKAFLERIQLRMVIVLC